MSRNHRYIESSYQMRGSFCGRIHTHDNVNLNKIIISMMMVLIYVSGKKYLRHILVAGQRRSSWRGRTWNNGHPSVPAGHGLELRGRGTRESFPRSDLHRGWGPGWVHKDVEIWVGGRDRMFT